MIKGRKILFEVEADPQIGWGHLRRCESLAQSLIEEGAHCFFSPIAPASPVDIALFDRSHSRALAQPDAVISRVKALKAQGTKIVILDGLAPQVLAPRAAPWVDLVIAPYLGAEMEEGQNGARHLLGADYFIFSKDYLNARARAKIREGAVRRVVLSFGGADPQRQTLKALTALMNLGSHDWDVDVIVGPGLSPEYRSELQEVARGYDGGRVNFLVGLESLVEPFLKADLALSATGLTKYELALLGVPGIQVSVDREHAQINQAFEATGVAVHLGVASQVGQEEWALAIGALVGDFARRREMSDKAMRLIDGQGTRRVIVELNRLIQMASLSTGY